MSASVQDTLRGTLDEDLGSVSDPGGLLGRAVGGHGLAVARELQGELLLPLGLNILESEEKEKLSAEATKWL